MNLKFFQLATYLITINNKWILLDCSIFKNYFLTFKSNATVYSKEEVIKIFKSKIHKLDMLYKQQLAIINDKVLTNRKKFLMMQENESGWSSSSREQSKYATALKKYKKRSNLRVHLKKKLNRNNEPKVPHLDCRYSEIKAADNVFKCKNRALPLASYCKKRTQQHMASFIFLKETSFF